MILADIRGYLQARGQATLADLALHFDTDPQAMRGMLEQWVRKGKVRKKALNISCGSSCDKCDTAATEVYEWIASASDGDHESPVNYPSAGGCSCGS